MDKNTREIMFSSGSNEYETPTAPFPSAVIMYTKRMPHDEFDDLGYLVEL